MRYIRLLRCVTTASATHQHLYFCDVVFTITTDLGDDFYAPSEPLPLSFLVERTVVCSDDGTPVYWKAGMRTLSVRLRIPIPDLFKGPATLHIFATSQPVLGHVKASTNIALPFWSHGFKEPPFELIIPCHIKLQEGTPQKHSFRSLPLDSDDDLSFKEELGESIARHLWDAGVITASFFSDMCNEKDEMSSFLPIASDQKYVRILELGCGIGVLGITVAGLIDEIAKTQGCTELESLLVLLTDVADAEEGASSNIDAAIEHFDKAPGSFPMKIAYENLDWDDGRQGKFGPLASSQMWDYVILSDCTYNVDSFPALVGTLSAIHAHNCELAQDEVKVHVLLATKPRHSSEESLFEVLEGEGWKHHVAKSIPIPRDNAEDEVVYIYTLEKGETPAPTPPPHSPAKKGKTKKGESPTPAPAPAPSSPGKKRKPATSSPAPSSPGKKRRSATSSPAPSSPGKKRRSSTKRKTPGQSTKATAGEKPGTGTSPTKKASS